MVMWTVLVTGATSGIGLATARLFQQRSWRVLGGYSATKLALRGFARCLRGEVRPLRVSA